MSSTTPNDRTDEPNPHRVARKPPIPASEVPRHLRPSVIFDEDITWCVKRQGRLRAPTPGSVSRHQRAVGVEIGVGAYLGTSINWEVYDDFEGDDGYDLEHSGKRIEVKSTRQHEDLCLRVDTSALDTAEWFILGIISGLQRVELVGHASREEVMEFGVESPHDSELWVDTDCLRPFWQSEPISPEKVRAVHAGQLNTDN